MRRTGDSGDGEEFRPVEFWQEEERAGRAEIRRQLVRWTVTFAAVAAGLMFTLWWAGSTVRFSAARAQGEGAATWRVFGVVTDAASGEPVPFASIADDAGGAPPLFHSMADHLGHYEHLTLAERHRVEVRALGYRSVQVEAGRAWYAWLPSGEQRLDVRLTRE
jgi:hypothetical protein